MKRQSRKKTRRITRKDLWSTCAWCGKRIRDDVEMFTTGGRVKQGVDLKEKEGQIVPLALERIGRIIPAIVPTADSEAREAGEDILFMLCSERCCDELTEAVRSELGE